MTKARITVTLDAELVRAAQDAVRQGRADSVSSWVSAALADRAARDRRLAALADAVADYESEHGVITDDELAELRGS